MKPPLGVWDKKSQSTGLLSCFGAVAGREVSVDMLMPYVTGPTVLSCLARHISPFRFCNVAAIIVYITIEGGSWGEDGETGVS